MIELGATPATAGAVEGVSSRFTATRPFEVDPPSGTTSERTAGTTRERVSKRASCCRPEKVEREVSNQVGGEDETRKTKGGKGEREGE